MTQEDFSQDRGEDGSTEYDRECIAERNEKHRRESGQDHPAPDIALDYNGPIGTGLNLKEKLKSDRRVPFFKETVLPLRFWLVGEVFYSQPIEFQPQWTGE